MPLILPGNVGSATAAAGFSVDNSCRFNPADSAFMHKTPNAGNRKKATFSCWFKRSLITSAQTLFWAGSDNSNYQTFPRFLANDKIVVAEINSGSTTWEIFTNRQFRDVGAWYHIVVALDTTQSTAANRVKIYVNGVQETDVNTDGGYPGANRDTLINTAVPHQIAHDYVAQYYGGYVAEACFLEGSQNAPTDFGEFDEDSGIWKPIDVSGLTFGTNGFYLDFKASGNLGNDANGGTDFTEVNLAAADQSTDTCTNNFATLNPLNNYWAAATFSEGNLVYTSNNTGDYYGISPSTIGVSKGKWYFEAKTSTASGQDILGITSRNMTGRTTWLGSRSQEYGYYQDNGEIRSNAGGGGSDTSYGQTYTVNDIIGIYMDLDNNLMYVSDNGSLMNSGAGHTITAAASTDSGFYHFAVGDNSDSTQVWQCNFGGTSGFAISSAVTDDNGYGNFEYSPNITGDSVAKKFYSLCTKNLAEFG